MPTSRVCALENGGKTVNCVRSASPAFTGRLVGLRDRDRKCTAVVVAAPDFSPVDPVLYMMGGEKEEEEATRRGWCMSWNQGSTRVQTRRHENRNRIRA